MHATPAAERSLRVGGLSRVEGEGGLDVTIRDGQVASVRLDIYEPPRFFEAFLRGRDFMEPPDITSRVCGICPVAYQESAAKALESACGVTVSPGVQALRRLLFCGEWIESHSLHVHMLHAPDFLGYDSGLAMAQDHPEAVRRGLRVHAAGNHLMEVIGGRAIHPVSVRVGGFHRAVSRAELEPVAEELRRARDDAVEVVRWTASLPIPEVEHDYLFVAMRHPTLYPVDEGRIVSTDGLDIDVAEYPAWFEEFQVPHSTALHSRLRGARYLVGPLARYALNQDRLSPVAREAAADAGLGSVCRNPYRSIVVRAVELLYACDEALRLIEAYRPPEPPFLDVAPVAAAGHGCVEAPRGLLYQRYRLGAGGAVEEATIIPPTAQNQDAIEADLAMVVDQHLDAADDELAKHCEASIRNHDPCISCATHFLDLRVQRE